MEALGIDAGAQASTRYTGQTGIPGKSTSYRTNVPLSGIAQNIKNKKKTNKTTEQNPIPKEAELGNYR